MKLRWNAFLLVLACFSSPSSWAQTYSVLKAFEGLQSPSSRLTRDSQGNLYGTTLGGGTWGQGTVFKLAATGKLTILHHFIGGRVDGSNPLGDLTTDLSGNIYGTTRAGGAGQSGTIFKLAPDGTYTVLHSLVGNDGGYPCGGLIRDLSGNLYGTANYGGPLGEGTLFRLTPQGVFTVLHAFAQDSNGYQPGCSLLRDLQGNLYGTTIEGGSGGGPFGGGTIFRLAPDGTHTVLYNFTGGNDGAGPLDLISVPGGDAVGVTGSGGFGGGTIFKLSTNGVVTVLYTFTSVLALSTAGLTCDRQGNLYGVQLEGGSGQGSVFKLAPDGTFSVLHSFTGDEGTFPRTRLMLDAAGNLYGTTSQGGPGGFGTLFALAPDGTLAQLHGFRSDNPNGVALDSRGNLFGTTRRGGVGGGSIFEFSSVDGSYTVLHAFSLTPGMDGNYPVAPVITDGSNNLYGTTSSGGPIDGISGIIFRLAANGTYTILYAFGSTPPPTTDGSEPDARLVLDATGSLYGTTFQGGSGGAGIVFKLASDSTYTILHSFNFSDGASPVAGLVMDTAGNLYGTTYNGGGSAKLGVVFRIAASGAFAVLHYFNGSDGTNPLGALVLDSSGNLYGTTAAGGGSNLGTVFKLAPDGTYSVLYNFNLTQGGLPVTNLIVDSAGNLYGTAAAGGRWYQGTVFKLAPDGTYSPLHSFSGNDGAFPASALILAGNVLYGTTSAGGPLGGGVVLQITF